MYNFQWIVVYFSYKHINLPASVHMYVCVLVNDTVNIYIASELHTNLYNKTFSPRMSLQIEKVQCINIQAYWGPSQ